MTSLSPQGYSFDQAKHQHIFAYREQMPSWFGMKDTTAPKIESRMIPGILLFSAFGLGVGSFISLTVGLFLAVVGGLIAFAIAATKTAAEGTMRAGTKLSGKSSKDGLVTTFQGELRVSEGGRAELFLERLAANVRNVSTYRAEPFLLDDVASVERRSYGEVHPEGYERFTAGNYTPATARRMAAQRKLELQTSECVVIVFDTGEEVEAAWAADRNSAAVLQSSLTAFMSDMREHFSKQQAQSGRDSLIEPGDEPL